MKNIYLLLLVPFLGFGQTQIGEDIIGNESEFLVGRFTSLSSDGNTLVVGRKYDAVFYGLTLFNIFRNISGTWTEIETLTAPDFDAITDVCSLSSDGNYIALNTGNTTKVFNNISNIWTQIGNSITLLGSEIAHISISSDGTTLALGTTVFNGSGNGPTIRMYRNIDNVWTEIAPPIQVTNQRISDITLSLDGSTIAFGSYNFASSNGLLSCKVSIYKIFGDTFNQIGETYLEYQKMIILEMEIFHYPLMAMF